MTAPATDPDLVKPPEPRRPNLLVTLCNRYVLWDSAWRDVYLLTLNTQDGTITPVGLPREIQKDFTGMTGIAPCPGGYVAVLQPSGLLFLSDRLEVRELIQVKELRDGHSIAFHDGKYYVVSTGTDSLLEFSRDEKPRVVWSASSSNRDTHHVNSVCWHKGECWVTMFGPKSGGLWSSASQGQVVNVSTGETILSGLHHPHSLIANEGGLLCCESARMTIRGAAIDSVVTTRGYLRGLAVERNQMFVGSSLGRKRSKSTGEIVSSAGEQGTPQGECGIVVLDRGEDGGPFQERSFIPLGEYANEIYDVIVHTTA